MTTQNKTTIRKKLTSLALAASILTSGFTVTTAAFLPSVSASAAATEKIEICTATTKVPAYQENNLSSRIVTYIEPGARVTILADYSRNDQWIHIITCQGQALWVKEYDFRPSIRKEELCTGSNVPVYQANNLNSPKIGTISRGERCTIIANYSSNDGWIHLQFQGGRVGWVRSNQYKPVANQELCAAPSPVPAYQRNSLQSPIVTYIQPGELVTIFADYSANDQWLHVLHKGKTLWIKEYHFRHIVKDEICSSSTNVPVYETNSLSKRIGYVYPGDRCTIIADYSSNDGVIHLTYSTASGNRTGWVRTQDFRGGGNSISYRQQKMVNAARSMLGSTAYNGYCQKFVRVVGEKAGLPSGNAASALDACNKWRVSTKQDNIPVGATVYLRGRSGAGAQYGHVGIYIGDGQVIHAVSTVRIDSLDALTRTRTYLGWGWQAGVDLR